MYNVCIINVIEVIVLDWVPSIDYIHTYMYMAKTTQTSSGRKRYIEYVATETILIFSVKAKVTHCHHVRAYVHTYNIPGVWYGNCARVLMKGLLMGRCGGYKDTNCTQTFPCSFQTGPLSLHNCPSLSPSQGKKVDAYLCRIQSSSHLSSVSVQNPYISHKHGATLSTLHNTTPTQELRLHGTCTYRVYVTVLVYMVISSVHTYIAVFGANVDLSCLQLYIRTQD